MKIKSKKSRKKKETSSGKKSKMITMPEYYQAAFNQIHHLYHELIFKKYVTEPIEIRRRLAKESRAKIEGKEQYDSLLDLLAELEEKMRLTISRRPAFYWFHICRRIAPGLNPNLGARTDATTLVEVRSHVEQAIFKFGSLTRTDGVARSNTVEFDEILGGMLSALYSRFLGDKKLSWYKDNLKKSRQLVLTDFSEIDIADMYHVHGLAYQYWYVTARLRSCGKGVKIELSENGDLLEQRGNEQNALICSFDERSERRSVREGFETNVGTFVRSKKIELRGMIFTAALNAGGYTAEQLKITGVDLNFSPNYLPFGFNAEDFYDAHAYLSHYFKKKTGFGLLEFCQISSILSKILISRADDRSTIKNPGVFYYARFQRAYKLYDATLTELKQTILDSIIKERAEGNLRESNAEQQIDFIVDFLTLDEEKQPLVGLWSHGPRYVIIKFGDSYFCDYSSWFIIFKNLFFGLRNYDPNSKKGGEFEYAFGEYAKSKSFNVIMQSRKITASGGEREIDVAIRIKDSLYVFECRAFERPLDFAIGKPKTIKARINDLKSKLDQVHTLVDFIKINRLGENYDFSWAKEIYGAVVSPYTEWIWSLDRYLWTDMPTFPRIMSAPEALDYLAAAQGAA
ncbi:hypothetical protein [Caballeronia sp. KNU42]